MTGALLYDTHGRQTLSLELLQYKMAMVGNGTEQPPIVEEVVGDRPRPCWWPYF